MAKQPLKVTRVSKRIHGTKITVYSKRGAQVVYDSFLGERIFFLYPGHSLTLTVKGWDWQVGDRLSMGKLVRSAWDWSHVHWDWYYGD